MANGQQSTLVREPSIQGKAFHGFQPSGVHPFVRDINIESMTVGKLTAGELTVDVDMTGDGALRSSNFVSGSSGWEILADGSAEFQDIVARGDIVASSVAADDITSGSLVATVDITSGEIRTSGSGRRLELDDLGLTMFIDTDSGPSEASLDWFRAGAGDSQATSAVRSFVSSGVTSILDITVKDYENDNPQLLIGPESTDAMPLGYSLLDLTKDRAVLDADFEDASSASITVQRSPKDIDVAGDEVRVDTTAGTRLLTVAGAPSNSDSSIFITYRDEGGTLIQNERVIVQGAGSGGAGFRALTVPN